VTSLTLDHEPSMPSLVDRLAALRATARRFPLSLLEFGMRLAVGATFFRSGMNKYQSFDTAITLFRDEYRLPLLPPEIAAYMGTTVELWLPKAAEPPAAAIGPPAGRAGRLPPDGADVAV